MAFDTPILFLVFNRPVTTNAVFQKIKEVQPKKLYIAADGPRNEGESLKCEEVKTIFAAIYWDCEVKTLYRDKNLGSGKAVSEAITWFFDQEEQGIILEDDCLPDLSFFNYCSVLLRRYSSNKSVWHISGNNFQNGKIRGRGSYYFSMYNHTWGWATWRDRWEHFKFDALEYNIELLLEPYTDNKEVAKYFYKHKFRLEKKQVDAWDYQYLFSMWLNKGLSIIPNKNLVRNIGFGGTASNTKVKTNLLDIPYNTLNEITFNDQIKQDKLADNYTFSRVFRPNLFVRFINRILNIIYS